MTLDTFSTNSLRELMSTTSKQTQPLPTKLAKNTSPKKRQCDLFIQNDTLSPNKKLKTEAKKMDTKSVDIINLPKQDDIQSQSAIKAYYPSTPFPLNSDNISMGSQPELNHNIVLINSGSTPPATDATCMLSDSK